MANFNFNDPYPQVSSAYNNASQNAFSTLQNTLFGQSPQTNQATTYPVSNNLGNWANQQGMIPPMFQTQTNTQNGLTQPFYELGTGVGQTANTNSVSNVTAPVIEQIQQTQTQDISSGITSPAISNATSGVDWSSGFGDLTSINTPTAQDFSGGFSADNTTGLDMFNLPAADTTNFLSDTFLGGVTSAMSNGDLVSGIGGLVSGGLGAYSMFAGLDQQQQALDISKGNLALNQEQYADSRADTETRQKQNREWYS